MSSYGKNNFIKTLATSVKYTSEQEEELLKCADPVDGPVYFMKNFVYIQHPVKGKVLFQPFDYQLDLIHTYHNYRFSIAMVSRQMGKCLTKDINITIKNKNSGDIYDLPIGKFYEFQKAKKDGSKLPDIKAYLRKNL